MKDESKGAAGVETRDKPAPVTPESEPRNVIEVTTSPGSQAKRDATEPVTSRETPTTSEASGTASRSLSSEAVAPSGARPAGETSIPDAVAPAEASPQTSSLPKSPPIQETSRGRDVSAPAPATVFKSERQVTDERGIAPFRNAPQVANRARLDATPARPLGTAKAKDSKSVPLPPGASALRSSNVLPPGVTKPGPAPTAPQGSAHARALGGPARPVAASGPRFDTRNVFDPVQIRLDAKTCRDLTRASKKEWLLTNGLGGYSMSTVSGLNTRRWHGLLVAAMRPPVGRAVVLSKMDETLTLASGPVALDTNFYPGVVHPRGFEHIESFSLYPFPSVVFSGPGWRLEKSIYLVHGENTVVITYKMLPANRPRRADRKGKAARPAGGAGAGDADASRKEDEVEPLASLKLRVRPLFAFRAASELSLENDRIQRTFGIRAMDAGGSVVRCAPYPEWEPVYLVSPDADFVENPDWYKNVEYPQERYRGLDYREDLWSYGYYESKLQVNEALTVVCTLHSPEKRTVGWPVEREIERRAQVMLQIADDKPFARRLGLAAEQFLVRRERELVSVVAGYPWMNDSSRDTMIALPGLLLVTGRFREAKAILRTYARALDRGMLPNRLPEGSERPEFGSVDATLWFFVAIFRYLQYTGDFDFVKTELRIPMLETVRYYGEGSRAGIRVDADGMLRCGEPGRSLTWMDARVGEQPVTQRAGKPVEVNALWYNALRIMERLAERFSIPSDMARFGRMAEKIEDNFLPVFWNQAAGCLYDVVDYAGPDTAIRPNQILAVSLPFPLLDSESAQSVVRVVTEKLLAPMGLRSLETSHGEFRGVYDGDPKQRDAALHQGSVWGWWMGPYLSALVKANGAVGRIEAAKLLRPFEQHLLEDGLGHVSEIFWGNAPHWPRGCPAHAPALAEILRAYHEDVLGKNPGRHPGVHEPSLRPR
jgi:predicted glycogen debranching enzyme